MNEPRRVSWSRPWIAGGIVLLLVASVWIGRRVLHPDAFPGNATARREPVPPQTGTSRRIERTGYAFDAPANWSVDGDKPGHDPRSVTLSTPNGGVLQVRSFEDRPTCEATFDRLLEVFHGQGGAALSETGFEGWGPLEGSGRELRSNQFGPAPRTIRIFRGVAGEESFLVMETFSDEAGEADRIGFQRASASFVTGAK